MLRQLNEKGGSPYVLDFQGHLFSLQDVLDVEPTKRYTAIFQGINSTRLLTIMSKKVCKGAPQSRTYSAMSASLFARILKGIPTITLLVRRLKNNLLFHLDCGFSFSDRGRQKLNLPLSSRQ